MNKGDFGKNVWALTLEFIRRCSRNWFPIALILALFLPMSGFIGHAIGLPQLFQDDQGLWSDEHLGHIRRSSIISGHATVTLVILALWTGIFLQDKLKPTSDAKPQDVLFSKSRLCKFLAANAWPFLAYLPIAAWLNHDETNPNTSIFADILKSLSGIFAGIVLAILAFVVLWALIYFIARLYRFFSGRFKGTKRFEAGLSTFGRAVFGEKTAYWLRVLLYVTVILTVMIGYLVYPTVIPAVALSVLVLFLVGLYFFLSAIPSFRRTWVVLVLVGFAFIAGTEPFPNKFPGFEKLDKDPYDEPLLLDQNFKANQNLLDPVKVLQNWKTQIWAKHVAQINGCDVATPSVDLSYQAYKPPLVVISTSGGAYRAGFWTAKVLDQFLLRHQKGGELEGIIDHVRLLVGASGGMVGSSYLAEGAPDPCGPVADWQQGIEDRLKLDIKNSRDATIEKNKDGSEPYPGIGKTIYPLDRDGLAPVAQQLLQRDIPRYVLSPYAYFFGARDSTFAWEKWGDRGLILEQQWHALDKSFIDFEPGEAAGWRPSLIYSPMLVETGRPMIISNLNTAFLSNTDPQTDRKQGALAVQLFDWFPQMQNHLKISTALRMNATFPYISPAVSLPTNPSRRVVDAGYFDNHGITVATHWLQHERIRAWIAQNTGGVIIIQIRAFDSDEILEAKEDNTAFQWLTSPLTGVASMRSQGSLHRNNAMIDQLKRAYGDGFVKTVVFENKASSQKADRNDSQDGDENAPKETPKEASMSWYSTINELDQMDEMLSGWEHNRQAMEQLISIWQSFR